MSVQKGRQAGVCCEDGWVKCEMLFWGRVTWVLAEGGNETVKKLLRRFRILK